MQFTLSLPDWAVEENGKLPAVMSTLEERMAAVIRFSRLNFERNTGGPFAAGVFELAERWVVPKGLRLPSYGS